MKSKYPQAEEIFIDYLKKGKNRITPERFEIMDAALDCKEHFSADDLYIRMKNNGSVVSRATVYKTLELLAQCELLVQRNFGENMKRYESNFKRQIHEHLICIDCGRIIEFVNNSLQRIQDEICEELDFEPSSYSYNIFARCKNKNKCPYYHGK